MCPCACVCLYRWRHLEDAIDDEILLDHACLACRIWRPRSSSFMCVFFYCPGEILMIQHNVGIYVIRTNGIFIADFLRGTRFAEANSNWPSLRGNRNSSKNWAITETVDRNPILPSFQIRLTSPRRNSFVNCHSLGKPQRMEQDGRVMASESANWPDWHPANKCIVDIINLSMLSFVWHQNPLNRRISCKCLCKWCAHCELLSAASALCAPSGH